MKLWRRSSMSKDYDDNDIVGTCLIYTIVYGGIWLISTYLFSYTIYTWFEKSLPWWVEMLGGLVCAGFIIPVAFITWVLKLYGLI